MISIEQRINLPALEDFYSKIGDKSHNDLRVPSSLRFSGPFGLSAAIVQFAATWARNTPHGRLQAYGSVLGVEAFRPLANEPHGLASIYFAPDLTDPAGNAVERREALSLAVPRVHAMQSRELRGSMHGRGAFLGCFAGAANEYLVPLYESGREDSLRGRSDFLVLTKRLIEAVDSLAARRLAEYQLVAISMMLYELFSNTNEHAVTDINDKKYSRNLRGIIVKFFAFPKLDGNEPFIADDPSLRKFFNVTNLAKRKERDEQGKQHAVAQTSFLEITVLDTGPGLARHWLAKTKSPSDAKNLDLMTLDQELELVRKCFELRATTKIVPGTGYGLDLVLKVLSQLHGYLRLRTGRLCLVQDFSDGKSKAFEPRHWLRDRKQLPLTEGTAYSIIIPLSRERS